MLFRNLGPLSQGISALATKALISVFLESWTFLFFLVPENADPSYGACFLSMSAINC